MMNTNIAMELNLDELAFAAGGDGLRDHPLYNVIKECYQKKGYGPTVNLCGCYNLSYAEMRELLILVQNDVG